VKTLAISRSSSLRSAQRAPPVAAPKAHVHPLSRADGQQGGLGFRRRVGAGDAEEMPGGIFRRRSGSHPGFCAVFQDHTCSSGNRRRRSRISSASPRPCSGSGSTPRGGFWKPPWPPDRAPGASPVPDGCANITHISILTLHCESSDGLHHQYP